jgi:hypothetical protein
MLWGEVSGVLFCNNKYFLSNNLLFRPIILLKMFNLSVFDPTRHRKSNSSPVFLLTFVYLAFNGCFCI